MKKLMLMLLCVTFVFAAFVGCTSNASKYNNQAQKNGTTNRTDDGYTDGTNDGTRYNTDGYGVNDGINNGINNRYNTNRNSSNLYGNKTTDDYSLIRDQINGMDGITYQDFTINGNEAVLRIKSDVKEFSDDVKTTIEKAVRTLYPHVNKVTITR